MRDRVHENLAELQSLAVQYGAEALRTREHRMRLAGAIRHAADAARHRFEIRR